MCVQPVYVKDDFFDSLSCDALDREEGRAERTKFSEQRKIDTEVSSARILLTSALIIVVVVGVQWRHFMLAGLYICRAPWLYHGSHDGPL